MNKRWVGFIDLSKDRQQYRPGLGLAYWLLICGFGVFVYEIWEGFVLFCFYKNGNILYSCFEPDFKNLMLCIEPEKAMAPHSSTLAWKIPWTEEPLRLQSMGSPRIGHNWVTSLSLFTFVHWGRKWQPTPVFLPGESQGQRSLVGCHLGGRRESDTTEAT